MWRTWLLGFVTAAAMAAAGLDLTHAVVQLPASRDPQALMAATVLIDEVRARTNLTLETRRTNGAPAIALIERKSGPAEGFKISTTANGVTIEGTAPRGLLYGVGKLLRNLEMRRGSVVLARELNVETAPETALRGHQLGYRPKTNSYDGWTAPMWEQYMRDLVIFGANAIELIPPRSDDDADSPHFPLPPMEMMVEMSRIAASYGLEVWVWYPALDPDYTTEALRAKAVAEWADVLRRLPRVDHVFVPGGDPGHTRPAVMMQLLEAQTASLRKIHPGLKMWMSPQGFNNEWMEEFYGLLKAEPQWLAGVVHGPQVRVSMHELRSRVPARYPVRNYPDITHSLQSQFPVPDWDAAHALTSNREPINPRPVDMRRYVLEARRDSIGFLTYSEGCNDDVNKAVWSVLGWDSKADLREALQEFGRYFIGPQYAEPFAKLLFDLEENWRGPIHANRQIELTLSEAQAMEKAAAPRDLLNWRLQQALYRAYYDAYTQRRYMAGDPQDRRVAEDLRTRVFALAEALFQSVRMQLSVPLYRAIGRERGATLDNLDWPITERTPTPDAGPGGFYDDLGNVERQPHLVRGPGIRTGFGSMARVKDGTCRIASYTVAEGEYDTPIELRYTGLERGARYKVRVVYGGERPRQQRLVANGTVEVQPMQRIEKICEPVEFALPAEATAGGELRLTFTAPQGTGGSGRSNQVGEVWLIRM